MVAKARKLKPARMLELRFERDGNRQTLTIPLRLESRANYRGHTRSRKLVRATQEQRQLTRTLLIMYARKVKPPVRLTCVRVAPRTLDEHENLPMAFKSVVDGVADWLGIDDRSGIECVYDQDRDPRPNTHGCRITIEPLR